MISPEIKNKKKKGNAWWIDPFTNSRLVPLDGKESNSGLVFLSFLILRAHCFAFLLKRHPTVGKGSMEKNAAKILETRGHLQDDKQDRVSESIAAIILFHFQ